MVEVTACFARYLRGLNLARLDQVAADAKQRRDASGSASFVGTARSGLGKDQECFAAALEGSRCVSLN
jgi:hypothetical protein